MSSGVLHCSVWPSEDEAQIGSVRVSVTGIASHSRPPTSTRALRPPDQPGNAKLVPLIVMMSVIASGCEGATLVIHGGSYEKGTLFEPTSPTNTLTDTFEPTPGGTRKRTSSCDSAVTRVASSYASSPMTTLRFVSPKFSPGARQRHERVSGRRSVRARERERARARETERAARSACSPMIAT